MSRCFPYPPPGYSLSRASNEALIESIKLKNEEKREKEKAKELKKREKKEKKKEKKEKKKEKNEELDKKLHKSEKAELLFKEKDSQTSELLERSSLTEEHGQPLCLNAPSTSSDSTDTSNKRKRDSSSSDNRGHGNIIRIKLTPKKQSDSDAPASSELRVVTPAQQKDPNILRVSRVNSQSSTKPEGHMCSNSRPVGAPMHKAEFPARPHVNAGNCSRPVDTVQQFKTGSPHRPVDNYVKTANPLKPTEVFKQVKTGISSRPAEAKQFKTGIPPRPTAAANQLKTGVLPPPAEGVKQVKTVVPPRPAGAIKQVKTGLPPRPVEAAKEVNPIKSSRPVDPTKRVATSPVEPVGRVRTCPPPMPSAPLTPMEIDAMNYEKLFENFCPPPLQVPCADEDLSWLFPSKRSDAVAEKRQNIQYDGISCVNSSALQPRAQWLKEGNLYALPYTLPF